MSGTAEGQRVRITFSAKRCIHSRGCVLSQPDVFKPNVEGRWIDPDGASPEAILAVAARCPSGAIGVERLDGGGGETPSVRNVIAVQENGPNYVRGDLRVAGEPAGARLALCRCGASKNKPYCDNSHVAAGFVATGEIAPQGEIDPWGERGPLEIEPVPDGPVKVTGALEVTTGAGHTVRRATVAFLCRCGQSANKPFCDGTHRKVGFTT